MAETAISSVIALVKAAIECCRTAKVHQKEAARIGKRLTVLVARAGEWTVLFAGGKTHSIKNFYEAVEKVYFCLQAASQGRNGSWKARALAKLGSNDLLGAILDAEKQLNVVITDLHLEQSNAIYARLDNLTQGVAALLDHFGNSMLGDNSNGNNVRKNTIQQQVATVLSTYQNETPELVITSVTETNESATPAKILFQPSHSDIEKIKLRRSKLAFSDDQKNFLGGGGFADVYRGSYNGNPVAIKRLKANARDVASVSKRQIQQDLERLSSEALMMHQCSSHPNVTAVIGCVTAFGSVERPLIVMELMSTTLFDVLQQHQSKTQLSFAHALHLLKGVAGALEFIHLQGIVHQDIKSLNILLDKDLTIAKLSDFGEAKVKGLNTTRLRQHTILATTSRQVGDAVAAGTLAYQAPELLAEEVCESSRVSEMYSFGVIVWECMTRKIPHGEKKTEAAIVLHAANKKHLPMLVVPASPVSGRLSSDDQVAWKGLQQVAKACLSRARSERLTSSLVVALWHNFKLKKVFDASATVHIIRNNPETLEESKVAPSKVSGGKFDEGQMPQTARPNPSAESFFGVSQRYFTRNEAKPSGSDTGNLSRFLPNRWKLWFTLSVVAIVTVIAVVILAVTFSGRGGGSFDGSQPVEPPSLVSVEMPSPAPTSIEIPRTVPALAEYSSKESLQDVTSPQGKALRWLVNDDPFVIMEGLTFRDDKYIQRYVMAVLYFSMDGDNWYFCNQSDTACHADTEVHSWLSEFDECHWYLVACNESGFVDTLDFEAGSNSNLNLKGEIPSEFQYLTSLRRIVISGMELTGDFLRYISSMSLLETILVPENKFTGSFSTTFAEDHPQLSIVDLSTNFFNGMLPENLDTLAYLTVLRLPENGFSGPIPTSFGYSSIALLNLADNSLEGEVPSSLYNDVMQKLELDGNSGLFGELQPEVGNMTNLEELSLGQTGMGGQLPAELFTLPKLEILHLHSASFFGPLPESYFAQLTDTLVSLWLFDNNFEGAIPVQAIEASEGLEELVLHGNPLLTGTIPEAVCMQRGINSGEIESLRVDCNNIQCAFEGCCDQC